MNKIDFITFGQGRQTTHMKAKQNEMKYKEDKGVEDSPGSGRADLTWPVQDLEELLWQLLRRRNVGSGRE